MRLRKILNILEDVIPELKIESTQRNTNPRTHQLSNVESLQDIVLKLDELDLIPDSIEVLKEQSFYSYNGDNLIIQDTEFRIIQKEIPILKTICEGMSTAIENVIAENNPDLISIKIPPPQNFEELEETANKLNKIFGQTLLNEEVKGHIKITNFDTGTYWIDFMVGGATVVNVVAGLAWSAAVVYKKLQDGRLVQEQVRAMKISNSAFKEVLEKSNESLNEVADREANFVFNSFFKGKDPEQVARIKMSLKELAELYAKGAEIYPSIDAADKVIEQFPDFNKLENIATKVKNIEGKK